MEATEGGLTLCLVNDDPAQLMVQRRLLSRMATVHGFLSPLEALAAARAGASTPFLITDFHMPDMDGPELARVWCELHAGARVLLVSASEVSRQEQEKVDALPAGSVRLLTSYRITELQEQARVWFQEAPSETDESSRQGESLARLDRSVLEKLGKLGGADFVQKTVARFLRSGPQKVQDIERAFATGEYRQMHELSHALKGSCGLVGAQTLSTAADRIETATSDQGDREGLENLVREVVAECQATVADLEAFRVD